MICPKCHTSNRKIAVFCKQCGHFLAGSCPNCGSDLPEQARFCDICGHPLAGPSSIQPEAEGTAHRPSEQPPFPAADFQSLERYVPAEVMARLEAGRAQGGPIGERRNITVLFCDMSGSTAAAEQLDPEEWTEIVNAAFDRMIGPIYQYEGTVARLMGDGILAFFGAPIAHEDDPQRAILAGLDIVAGFQPFREQMATRWGVEFDVRVGINTGMAVVGAVGSNLRMEYTATGDVINLASRIEQAARPGTVLITGDTYGLVAPLFDVEDLGDLAVKGKQEPVQTYRVLGQRETDGGARDISAIETPLVGREEERAHLSASIVSLRRGVGGIFYLIGDAGLGKSRLIREVKTDLVGSGADIAWFETGSTSYETGQPYGLFRRLLGRVMAAAPDDTPEQLQDKLEAFVAEMSPGTGGDLRRVLESLFGLPGSGGQGTLEGEAFRSQLFAATAAFWRERASRSPVILVCDDLHWADPASVDLLRHLLSITEDAPLLLLCALRPDHQTPGWALHQAAETGYPHRYHEIVLSALSRKDAGELVDNLLPMGDSGADMRRRILEKSEGNPLFVEEVVGVLIDQGIVARDSSGTWRQANAAGQEIEIPGTVKALLLARIDRLDEGARQLLQLASVMGRSFTHQVLAFIFATSDRVERHLRTLQRAGLIREAALLPAPEYLFRHPLTQEAVYSSILRRQRRHLHRQVAKALEALYPDQRQSLASTLAHHYVAAHDQTRALPYLIQAGDAAFRLFATREALEHYNQAMAIYAEPDFVQDEVPGDLLRGLYLCRGRSMELDGRHSEALSNYEAMAAEADRRDDPAMVLASLIARATIYALATSLRDPQNALELSQQALELSRQLGDRKAEAQVQWNLMLFHYGANRPEQALGHAEASLDLARALGLKEQIAYTLNDLQWILIRLGDYRYARRAADEARGQWRDLGNLAMLADNLSKSSLTYALIGEHARAIEMAEEGHDVAHSHGNNWSAVWTRLNSFYALRELGEYARLLEHLAESRILAASIKGAGPWAFHHLCFEAQVYGDLGQAETGLEILQDAAAYLDDLPAFFFGKEVYFGIQASLHLALRDYPAARAALGQLDLDPARAARAYALAYFVVPVACGLSLAEGDDAHTIDLTGEVIPRLERAGQAIALPALHWARGLALVAQGDDHRAAHSLTQAVALAEASRARRTGWKPLVALADIEERRGHRDTASAHRDRARAWVRQIAERTPQGGLRDSFLSLPETQRCLGQR